MSIVLKIGHLAPQPLKNLSSCNKSQKSILENVVLYFHIQKRFINIYSRNPNKLYLVTFIIEVNKPNPKIMINGQKS